MLRRHRYLVGLCVALIAVTVVAPDAVAQSPTRIATFPDRVGSVRAVDLNHDGRDDLVVGSACNVSVLMARGGGGYSSPVTSPFGATSCTASLGSLAIGDVNGDGNVDVLAGRTDASSVWVFTGNGSGGLAPGVAYPAEPVNAIATGDVNDDGRDDVIVMTTRASDFFPNDIQVLLAAPAGGLAPAVSYGDGHDFHYVFGIATGYIDDDDHADVVAAVQRCAPDCVNDVMEFPGHADGTIGTPGVVGGVPQIVGQVVPVYGGANGVLTAPLRDSGRDDVIVTQNTVQTMVSAPDGTLTVEPPHPASIGGPGGLGDLDRDGLLDIALAGRTTWAQLSLLLGDGEGDFDVEYGLRLSGFAYVVDAQIADADADGWPDVVFAASALNGTELQLLANVPTGEVDPASLDFGSRPAGSPSDPKTVTLANAWLRPLQVGAASVQGPYAITIDQCSSKTVVLLDACDIGVRFVPTAGGRATGKLTIPSDDPAGPATVTLTGTGVAPQTSVQPRTVVTPDRTAPAVTVATVSTKLAKVLRRGLAVDVGCSEPCRLIAKLTVSRAEAKRLGLRKPAQPLLVGRATARLTAAGKRRLTIKLSRTLRTRAAKAKRVKLTLTVNAKDAARNRTIVAKTVQLRR